MTLRFTLPASTDFDYSEIDEKNAENNREHARRRCSVAAESLDPNLIDDEGFTVVAKSDDVRKHIEKSINSNAILSSIPLEAKAKMIDCMSLRETIPDEIIMSEGDDADNFYVVYAGVFDIYQNVKGQNKLIASCKQEGAFGELALMYNTPRSATVVSKTKGILYYINRAMFRMFVVKSAHKKRKCYENFLSAVPLLSNLSANDRSKLSDAFIEKEYKNGEKIFSQGEVGREMYFIIEGKVKITRTTEKRRSLELKVLTDGDFFGELALITQKPRAASAYSVGDSKLVALNVQAFERLLGPCEVILKKKMKEYEDELKEKGGI